jgi:hypothetical protein
VRVERGPGGTNCVGSGKSLKGHILSLVNTRFVLVCCGRMMAKPKKKEEENTQNGYY